MRDYGCTFFGLYIWHHRNVEKLGNVVVAHAHGCEDKVAHYMKNLTHFKNSVEQALRETRDEEKKRDLQVLWNHSEILINHVQKMI